MVGVDVRGGGLSNVIKVRPSVLLSEHREPKYLRILDTVSRYSARILRLLFNKHANSIKYMLLAIMLHKKRTKNRETIIDIARMM